MNNIVISCENLSKVYHQANTDIHVLNNITFTLNRGERLAIVGNSGSGKSTLLNLLAGLDKSSSGKVTVCNKVMSELSENQRALFRNRHLGFVYQFHHLLNEFSAIENVTMPLLLNNYSILDAKQQAFKLICAVGLKDRIHHMPSELSGGERQRVAIARALVTNPDIIFMDEPTGNLDSQTAESIQQLILNLSQEHNLSFIVVTHDIGLASQMNRIFRLVDGVLIEKSKEDFTIENNKKKYVLTK